MSALVGEAESVLAELRRQANDYRDEAAHAQEQAQSATDDEAARTALRKKLDAERSAEELDQQIVEQNEQLDAMRLRLSQVSARCEQLKSQRDVLSARLKAAEARMRLSGSRQNPRSRHRGRMAAVVVGLAILLIVGVGLLFWMQSMAGDPAAIAPSPPPTVKSEDVESLIPHDREFRVLDVHPFAVYAVTFSSDGRYLASSAHDGTARLWDVASGREIRQFQVSKSGIVFSVAFSPNGKELVASGIEYNDHAVTLWDVGSGREILRLKGHKDVVQAVAFSPNGRTIASGGVDSLVRLWDRQTGQQIGEFIPTFTSVASLGFSHDGSQLIAGSANASGGEIVLIDVQAHRHARSISAHPDTVLSAVFSRDDRKILSGGRDGTVELRDISGAKNVRRFFGHTDAVAAVAFLANDRYVVSGSFDGTVRLWDADSGRQIHIFQDDMDKHAVRGLAVSPDNRYIATAGLDSQVRLWRIPETLETAGTTPPEIAEVRFVGFIDGNDELRLYQSRADWNHRKNAWSTNMTLNGMDWDPRKNTAFSNLGKTRFMPDKVIFQDAKLTINKGRGTINFETFPDSIYISFVDVAPGGGPYDVTVRLPVRADEESD